jgi:ectoine hydroxylase-related dioxygenase (phytanoyl-CoA dioxygenase family)
MDGLRLAQSLANDGFAIVQRVFNEQQLDEWRRAIEPVDWAAYKESAVRMHGARNLLAVPAIQRLVSARHVTELVEAALGTPGIPIRGILFNKVAAANWGVAWHQDRMVAVHERQEVPGFGPWSLKEGVWHVEPPPHVLERMVTLRIHLDDCFAQNGPLRIVPGSHRDGKLGPNEIEERYTNDRSVTCTAARGGVVFMRPLVLHSSSKAIQPSSRRVIHLEFASEPLQNGLEWCSFASPTNQVLLESLFST